MNPIARPRVHAAMATLLATVLFLVLSGCATGIAPGRGADSPEHVDKPRLVVLLVIDGLPQWQVTDYRAQLGPDGLNRFLERGTWFADAHYGHAYTVTAAGHAAMLTGAYPHRTGIIGNEWRDPVTGRMTYCTEDTEHVYLGHKTSPLAGTSPKNLRAEALGDVLKAADARSKVVAISAKDRGAILPAGRAGTAYMYMEQTGQFASSTWYMKAHPAWVTAFNDARPANRFFGATWTPLLPGTAYARSVPDGQPWYAKGGSLPKTMGEGMGSPGPLFYSSLLASPFGDSLTLDFALAALAGESLGADAATDILSVSLSSHDYVNHAWGAESRMSHDHLLQVDKLLAAFFRELDSRVGADNYVAILTADHGFMPVPEYSTSRGMDGGRQNASQTLARLNAALEQRFGTGSLAKAWSAHGILLDRPLIAQRGIDPRAVDEEAKKSLLADPAVAAVISRGELESASTPDAPYLKAVRRGWHRELSADLQVVPKPGWMFTSFSTGTTHGSPHAYDTHVPILLYGPRWVKPGRVDARVEVVDIAPTLAGMLGVAVPAQSEGRPLPLPQ